MHAMTCPLFWLDVTSPISWWITIFYKFVIISENFNNNAVDPLLRRVQAQNFWKDDFKPWVRGPWLRHVPATSGWFWVHKPNAAHVRWGLGAKSGPKNQNLKKLRQSLAHHFGVVKLHNQIKNGRVMPIQSWGKNGIWAKNWPFWPHF